MIYDTYWYRSITRGAHTTLGYLVWERLTHKIVCGQCTHAVGFVPKVVGMKPMGEFDGRACGTPLKG